MLHRMMKQCCSASGQPDIGKMKEYMEHHDRAARQDMIGWSLFIIWVGIAWMAEVGLGFGLLGVAVIICAMQVVRMLQGLRLEFFWLMVGAGFGIGGVWELFEVKTPFAPLVLIVAGIALLAWQFAPRTEDS